MKLTTITTLALFCILTIGCQEENMEKPADERLMNSKLVNTYNDIAIQNAIISEHTLFPYQFVKNSAELNELGQRDLAVLAAHFARNGGHLNIRQLDTPADLYEARIGVVRKQLIDAGIDMGRINMSDGMPGGSGMASQKVSGILEQELQRVGTKTSTTYSTEMR
ncbi:MAG: hypothetical protein ACYSWO_10495 [Planctomycetota bacterium]|jgi:hypothetical protein